MGKRVKFHYKGVQKVCTNCFGPHPRKTCQSQKTPWLKYVAGFISSEMEIPRDYFGRWIEIIEKAEYNTSNLATHGGASTLPPQQSHSRSLTPESATSSWILENQSLVSDQVTTKPVNSTGTPTRSEFKVPESETHHNEIIGKLVLGGSTKEEAELIIASRRTAFNKALRLHKKPSNKTPKVDKKKASKQSKNVSSSQSQNGN